VTGDDVLKLAKYCFNNGEILNSYMICKSSPVKFRGAVLSSDLFKSIETRLDTISDFQNNGRENSGFVDPPDAQNRVIFQKLLEELKDKPIRRMVDVGCFSGWVGRHLALRGIQVLGIDLDPFTISMAKRMATGTMASYEVLEGTKVGVKYPKRFDGAILFDVLEHVFDPYILRDSVNLAVKDGGWVFINLPKWQDSDEVNEDFPDEYKEHIRTYNEDEVKKLFPSGKIDIMSNEDGSISFFITYQV